MRHGNSLVLAGVRSIIPVVALSAACAVAADSATLRTEIAYGDVSLQGPIGLTLDKMLERHVLAEDPVYLSQCFKEI